MAAGDDAGVGVEPAQQPDRFAEVGDYATARAGDPCPRCGAALEVVRSVEAAHIFQLGLVYSLVMPGGTFTAEDGSEQPFYMGCYGFGVSRVLAVLAETFRDDEGLCWPRATAPYDVHLCALGAGRTPEVAVAADALYDALVDLGLDVCFDDRDVSAGIAFADADLLGAPLRVTVGKRGLERGIVEARERRTGDVAEVELEGAAAAIEGLVHASNR